MPPHHVKVSGSRGLRGWRGGGLGFIRKALQKGYLKHPGEAGFSFPGGGGSIEPSSRTPPSPKKGSIDRTPKILPSLTPRPWR